MGTPIRDIFLVLSTVLVAAIPAAAQSQYSTIYQQAFEAMRADLNDPEKSFEFAVISIREGDVPAAIEALERVLRLDMSRDNIRADLGYLYIQAGNPALAEQYLRAAKAGGAAPAIVSEQIDDLLEIAVAAQQPTTWSGSVVLGARYETNATGGPDNIPSLISGAADDDYSVSASARFDMQHDLGYQNGASFDMGLDLFASQYGDDASPETALAGLQAGFSLPVGSGRRVSPYLHAGQIILRGDGFRTEYGAGLRYRATLDPAARYQFDLKVAEQSYEVTASSPNAAEQDGTETSARFNYSRSLQPNVTLNFGVSAAFKDAAISYETYSTAGVSAQLVRQFGAGSGPGGQPWSAGTGLGYRWTGYDAPDPSVAPGVTREDDQLTAEIFVQVPITDRADFLGSVSWTNNKSNYATEDYDNLGAFIGVRFQMGGSG